jgi:hypothetical protein
VIGPFQSRARMVAGEALEVVTLRGHHAARGALIVVGTRRTVRPATPHAAYYVYDQARDEAFMADSLVPRLGLQGVTAEALSAAARAQLGAS